MTKILLLGPNGQLGWELRRALAPLGDVFALPRQAEHPSLGMLCGDLAQPDALADTVRRLKPDVVVNAAAHTAVDRAESEPDLAHRINAESPGALARAVAESGGWLVHYSTDYVFDGSSTQARDETAPTAPQSVYGRSKLAGEQAVQASGVRHLIFRTSWVHAARGGNFAQTMLRLASERDTLRVINDQIGAPTGADLIADVTAHALRQARQAPALGGLYHLVASGETSWFDYARHVLAWAQARGLNLKVTADAVQPTTTADYPTPARRPLNSRLDTTRLRQAFGMELPAWQQGVDRMLEETVGRQWPAR